MSSTSGSPVCTPVFWAKSIYCAINSECRVPSPPFSAFLLSCFGLKLINFLSAFFSTGGFHVDFDHSSKQFDSQRGKNTVGTICNRFFFIIIMILIIVCEHRQYCDTVPAHPPLEITAQISSRVAPSVQHVNEQIKFTQQPPNLIFISCHAM